ncbi:D-2-hydroxyacid dehydrogenase [Ectopseudomonas mendocina]|uniref:D-2-hydroxyacid dehydrogenase n=1 Tax=Ectopseudomonas mendocina TaxID=300 RepID=A0ABZ2RRR7_ECTME
MRLLIAERQHQIYADYVRQQVPYLDVFASDDPATLCQQAGNCTIWLGQPDLLAGLLRQGHKPDWLQSTWAGIKPLLATDLPHDYQLTRAVGIFGQVMAEFMLCHMLAHQRQLAQQWQEQRERHWNNRSPQSLAGRRVLIVGTGDIGLRVAQFLAPFGLKLTGIASSARQLPPFERVGDLRDLPTFAAETDFLINLLPDTDDTHDLYDEALFACMQPHALFINAGRGGAVVDSDLVAALQQGQLAGAVIDVCRQEPLLTEHPFWNTPNLLLTGHSSAPTDPHLMAKLFIDNLRCYQSAKPLMGRVDFSRGY